MWILIAAFITIGPGGVVSNAATFQEFASKESCEAAIHAVKELQVSGTPNQNSNMIRMRCVAK